MPEPFDLRIILLRIAAFGLVATVWAMGILLLAYFWRRRGQKMRQRMEFAVGRAPAQPRTLRLWHAGEEATTQVVGRTRRASFRERLTQLGRDAGWKTAPATVLAVALSATLVSGLAVGFWFGRPLAGLATSAVVGTAFALVTSKRINARSKLFDRQLIDALELSSRALRVGHPLLGSFQLIADEIPEPVGPIFNEIRQQQDLGIRAEDALMRAATLSQSPDLRLFATSLAINIRAGGNIADVMEGLAFVIRERMRLSQRFKVLAAQTQVSKRILLALPVVMFIVMNLINKEYMATFYDSTKGTTMLTIAGSSLLLGWFVMNRMGALRQ